MVDLPAVLQLVNQAREATGLPPLAALPKGLREQARECPIALALNYQCAVDGDTVNYADHWKSSTEESDVRAQLVWEAWYPGKKWDGSWHVPLPRPLHEFVREFDGKKLPEFENLAPLDPEEM